mmetsp:Transcript_32893/g.94440  ORF Transcript_32893/g.94440 Transcript_32893/m.94440 type:complete len:223 (+) Transcript_32893:499-1167(+)
MAHRRELGPAWGPNGARAHRPRRGRARQLPRLHSRHGADALRLDALRRFQGRRRGTRPPQRQAVWDLFGHPRRTERGVSAVLRWHARGQHLHVPRAHRASGHEGLPHSDDGGDAAVLRGGLPVYASGHAGAGPDDGEERGCLSAEVRIRRGLRAFHLVAGWRLPHLGQRLKEDEAEWGDCRSRQVSGPLDDATVLLPSWGEVEPRVAYRHLVHLRRPGEGGA